MDTDISQRVAAKRLTRAHLRLRGTPPASGVPRSGDAVAGAALPMGFLGVRLCPDGSVRVDGDLCRAEPRRLADLLRVDGPGGGRFFADRLAVVRQHRDGFDPVLYRAYRDFLPPRHKFSAQCRPAGASEDGKPSLTDHILADLVVYLAGRLPGGEPYRSTGHWNLPGQLEIFQTLAGRVAMLVAGHTASGRRFLYEQVCDPGDTVVVPFGAWHVTYVLTGPAAVVNVTTMVDEELPPPANGSTAAEKYQRAEPVAITARWREGCHGWVGTESARRAWGDPGPAPAEGWLRPWLPPGEPLADLHLYASPGQLAGLQRAATEAYASDWPPG